MRACVHAYQRQVRGLCQPASRALLSALVRAAKSHPRAVIQELILPLVRDKDLGSAQVPIQLAVTINLVQCHACHIYE